MSRQKEPIACTLGPAAAADQALEWNDLQQLALATSAVPGGVRMRFPATLRPQVVDLAQREAACCRFLDITISAENQELILLVTSADAGALPVISALTGVPLP